MFDFEDYKNYLIDFYVHNCDKFEDKRLERKKILEDHYSDEKLQQVVCNTEAFIKYFINDSLEKETPIFRIPLYFDDENIFTNTTGGWYPDTLISISPMDENIRISLYLLKLFLGKDFKINFMENAEQIVDEIDEDATIISYRFSPERLIMSNLEALRLKQEELKNVEVNKLARRMKEHL